MLKKYWRLFAAMQGEPLFTDYPATKPGKPKQVRFKWFDKDCGSTLEVRKAKAAAILYSLIEQEVWYVLTVKLSHSTSTRFYSFLPVRYVTLDNPDLISVTIEYFDGPDNAQI